MRTRLHGICAILLVAVAPSVALALSDITPKQVSVCLDADRTVEERAAGLLGDALRTDRDFSSELRFADAEAFVVELAAKGKFDEVFWRSQYLERTTDEKLQQRLPADINLPDIHFSNDAANAVVVVRQSPRTTVCNLLLLGPSMPHAISGIDIAETLETRFGTFTSYRPTADPIEIFAIRPTEEFARWRPDRPQTSVFYSFEKPRNP